MTDYFQEKEDLASTGLHDRMAFFTKVTLNLPRGINISFGEL
jgi:hypothetical protein